MDTRDLTEHEQLVLIGLVKLIVHADQVVSPEERAMLGALQRQLGESAWNERVRAASQAFATIPALEDAAQQVERREAQRLIHRILEELAGSDEVIPAEAHVLTWIDQTWALTDDEEESQDPIESFDLLDDDD